jgi:hypothetical protein
MPSPLTDVTDPRTTRSADPTKETAVGNENPTISAPFCPMKPLLPSSSVCGMRELPKILKLAMVKSFHAMRFGVILPWSGGLG